MVTAEPPPQLTDAEEELLLVLSAESARSIPPGPVRVRDLAVLVERSEKESWTVLLELRQHGLVVVEDFGPGRSLMNTASLTELGQKAASNRALVDPKGSVVEFVEGLSPLELKILDVVAEREIRAAGFNFTRGQARAAVRKVTGSTADQVSDAITSLAGRHLTVGQDDGSSCRVTLSGLLACKWGTNAVAIVDGLFPLLREAQDKDVAFRQFSWTQIRRGLNLPRKAADLFHMTVIRSGIGNGIFGHSGDDWWIVPDNLDKILDEPSGIAFLRTCVTEPPSPDKLEKLASERANQVLPSSQTDPKKVFIIHGRNVAARNAVEQFVRSLGLEPLDFDHVSADLGGSPFVGEVVRRGLELAQGVVALFTPDEAAVLRPRLHGKNEKSEERHRWQARPNVIFEAGMAYGMMPKRTVLVTLGSEVALFSDVGGVHVVRLTNDVESRKRLRQKFIGVGCSVDERADAWTDPERAGDFEACLEGFSEMNPLDALVETGIPQNPLPAASAPSISLNLSYRKLPNSDGKTHHYELLAALRNGSRKRIDDWYIEVELPSPLEEPNMTVVARVRSQDGVTRFRTSSRIKPLLAGDEFRFTIPYRMNDSVFSQYHSVLDQWVATGRAFVRGEQIAEVVLRDIQNF